MMLMILKRKTDSETLQCFEQSLMSHIQKHCYPIELKLKYNISETFSSDKYAFKSCSGYIDSIDIEPPQFFYATAREGGFQS